MSASDPQTRKPIGAAGHRAAVNLAAKGQRYSVRTLVLVCAVLGVISVRAQTPAPPQTPAQTQSPAQVSTPAPSEPTEKTAGNYAVNQSIEVGYRDSLINGNLNNYDTFENLSSGLRLFDYTVDMRSIDHRGPFFDNLSFTNSGYGGDPNDISRLHIDKDKWYDFRVMFRRDDNFWNYDLLANPLNPAVSPIPGATGANSPHALDLSRRMQDYDLTLFPQSRLRFRVGYSRNANTGPAYTTVEGGTEPVLSENVNEITNSYRTGVDYRAIPKTTLSFDELLIYSAINNSAADNNLSFQLSNGTPVDLGIVSVGTSPCAAAAITPPTVSPTCNAYLSYSQVQNPRSSFPVERFSFQSTYFKNLSMSGSASYSTGDNIVSGFNETIDGWASRTLARGSTTGGPARANRVATNANWSGDYRVTDKLDLFDRFSYDNWRIPSMWATADTSVFDEPVPAGQSGMLLLPFFPTPNNLANFATLCPAPYNGPSCPQHNSSSGADVTDEFVAQFLGQNIRSNTFEVKYDFTRRIGAYVGYEYTARTIEDFSATWDTGEFYFPGGAGGTPGLLQPGGLATGNYFNAARGDCAVIKPSGALPAACTYNAANASIQEGSSANPAAEAGNDAARNVYDIHENAGLLGVAVRPTDALRINADLIFGYNDNSFTRISPRQVQSYKLHVRYSPRPWANVDGAVDLNENRDNVSTVNDVEHARAYSFVATLSPDSRFWVNFGYNYLDIFVQTEICFPDTGSAIFTTPCPVAGASSPLGTLSNYSSHDNYAYGDVMWKPHKRATLMLGYGGSIVRGNTTFLSPLAPTGTLDFDYIKPFASLAIDIYKGVTYKTAWNYYDYNNHGGAANPVALAPLPSQAFGGSNLTFSLRYAF
jgi:hypothetical protein